MTKSDIYKKGINDASESYHRKFDYISEEMRNTLKKQDGINERNYQMQKQILDNEDG